MTAKINKKQSLLCVLEILREYSDNKHILKQSQLLDLVEINYDLKIDRRTLYSNIDLLKQFGYDISDFNDNGFGYYLNERTFSSYDMNLIVDAILKDDTASSKAKARIITTIEGMCSKYNKRKIRARVQAYSYKK